MKIEDALTAIQEPQTLADVSPMWDESLRMFPAGRPFFLKPANIKRYAEYCNLPKELQPALLETAEKIAADPVLLRLAWHAYRGLFWWRERARFVKWPTFEKALGTDGGLFFVLITQAVVPQMRAFHQSIGVPESVTRDCCDQVRALVEQYGAGKSEWQWLFRSQMHWMAEFIGHRRILLRLGRMEYCPEYHDGAEVYRNRKTREVIALLEGGLYKDNIGYLHHPEWGDITGCTQTTFERTDTEVEGYPASPDGRVVQKKVRLSLDKWECVLKKGDQVLGMHIPAAKGMTPEACGASVKLAKKFWRRHFADWRPVAITSSSWIFNHEMEEMLPPTANLLQFQREIYLVPVPGSSGIGQDFSAIFYQEKFDPAAAPRNTSLQRGLLDYLAKGKKWMGANSMFILMDDIEKFGTQQYRRKWPPKEIR